MDAIETLMSEHRVIERVLDALVGFAEETARRETTEREELGRFVDFVREFADAFHHGKEEEILFAKMVEHGFPKSGGPIAVMLHEHDQGRRLVGILRERAAAGGAWTAAERGEIVEVAQSYAGLLRAHIHKEDAILYPMAEQHLPAQAIQEIGEACERYEQDGARAAAHERLVALAEELIRGHASTLHPEGAPVRHGCCG